MCHRSPGPHALGARSSRTDRDADGEDAEARPPVAEIRGGGRGAAGSLVARTGCADAVIVLAMAVERAEQKPSQWSCSNGSETLPDDRRDCGGLEAECGVESSDHRWASGTVVWNTMRRPRPSSHRSSRADVSLLTLPGCWSPWTARLAAGRGAVRA